MDALVAHLDTAIIQPGDTVAYRGWRDRSVRRLLVSEVLYRNEETGYIHLLGRRVKEDGTPWGGTKGRPGTRIGLNPAHFVEHRRPVARP